MANSENINQGGDNQGRSRLSHEIRSLIHGLLGYIAVFGDEVRPQLTVEQEQMFDRIEYFAQKLSDYVTDLLGDKE